MTDEPGNSVLPPPPLSYLPCTLNWKTDSRMRVMKESRRCCSLVMGWMGSLQKMERANECSSGWRKMLIWAGGSLGARGP